MKYLQELIKEKNCDLRLWKQPLGIKENYKNVMSVYNFSEMNGGTFDGFKYYNDYYIYQK